MEAQFTTLLKRLEAATIKLEDIVATGGKPGGAAGGKTVAEGASTGSASVAEYDELVGASASKCVALGKQIGGLLAEQAEHLQHVLDAHRNILVVASRARKPDNATLQELVKPMFEAAQKVVDIREKNRPSPLFNHLSVVSEGIPALQWVVIEPKPAPHVDDMKQSAKFYSDRVLREYKDKDQKHIDWANSFLAMLADLQAFIKKHHTTGLVWNAKGDDPKSFVGAGRLDAAPTTTSTATGTSAPPTPTTPSVNPAASLFKEINKDGITAALRKVDKSEMTHKNPALRVSSAVPASISSSAVATPISRPQTAKLPKFALDGNKWCVENQDGNRNIVIDQTELKHVVYIYNCVNCTIQIKGKVNAITFDNCKKTGLVLDSAVSSVDIVNCKSVQVQITGKAPTAVIDKTDGLLLFLSKECLDIEVLTAKSSELNITVPGPTENDDPIELAVPEQFKTVVQNGALVTGPVEHKG